MYCNNRTVNLTLKCSVFVASNDIGDFRVIFDGTTTLYTSSSTRTYLSFIIHSNFLKQNFSFFKARLNINYFGSPVPLSISNPIPLINFFTGSFALLSTEFLFDATTIAFEFYVTKRGQIAIQVIYSFWLIVPISKKI